MPMTMKYLFLFLILSGTNIESYSQVELSNVKLEKPFSNKDSFLRYVEDLASIHKLKKDSIEKYITTYITPPQWIESNNTIKKNLLLNEMLSLKQIAQIQLDWHQNSYNKDVEDFFKSIQVLDQKYRWDLQNCIIKTKNKDSCWKAFPIVTIIDSLNILSMDSFIQLYGYPKQKWAGDGFNSFTLAYYHHNMKNLMNDISLIEKAYNLKFIKKRDFISLYDTYLLDACQNQKYKTWDCFSKKQNKTVPCTPCLMNKERCNCKDDE
jgi:hypothetical protein